VTLEQVQGVLLNVDSISGEATVQLKDGSTITIDLAQVDLATVSGVIGAASLEAGDEVTLDVDQEGHAQKVKAHHTEVKGTLTAVDAAASTITIERDGASQTLTVSPTAKVEVSENEHATLADLTIGVQVEAKVGADGVVVKLEDDDEEDGGEHGSADPIKATGTRTTVNADAHTIEVTHPDGSVETLTVTATTKLDLEGPDTFTGLSVGMAVVTKVDPLTGALLKVQEREGHDEDAEHENFGSGNAEQREVKGTITALDADAQSVTITSESGVPGTYTVTGSTQLDLEGDNDAFAALAVGMRVEAKVNPLTSELLELDVDD
jgi:hypothetical protein